MFIFIDPTPSLRWNTTGITLVGLSGVPGNTSNRLRIPRDVVWQAPNILYVADSGNNRVQKYIMDNNNGVTVAGQANATAGSLANYLNSASCVRIDSNNGIYVADTFNSRIQFYSSGTSFGVTVAGNGTSKSTKTLNKFILYLFRRLHGCIGSIIHSIRY